MGAVIVITGTADYPVAHVEGTETANAVIGDLPWIIGHEPTAVPVGDIESDAEVDDRRG